MPNQYRVFRNDSNGTNDEWQAGDQSDLFKAVVDGEVDKLRTILDTGVDASFPDSDVSAAPTATNFVSVHSMYNV